MKVTFNIDENEVMEAASAIDPRITLDMVRTHVLTDEDTLLGIIQWGARDTGMVERIADRLSLAFTGRRWPTYGDPREEKLKHQEAWDRAMDDV